VRSHRFNRLIMSESKKDDVDEMEIDDVDENEVSQLAQGTMVELTGLSKAAFLNGQIGEVVCYFEDKDRYQVNLGPDSHKKVRATNIKVCEDQKVTRAGWKNKILARRNQKLLQSMYRMKSDAEQKKALYMIGFLFTFLVLFMLVQTGALSYIYQESFAAPYLQMVGDPIYDNALLPIYEKALVPGYENILVPFNDHVIQPVLGVLKQISDALAEYVLRPIQNNVLQPLFDNVLKPLFEVVKGVSDAAKGALKSVLEPIFGGGDSTNETVEETLGEAASTPNVDDLVEEIEHTEL